VADSIREATIGGDRLIGTALTLPGAVTAELLAEPFDFVWIDLEHGALGPAEAQEMVLGAQSAGAFALVRIPADAHRLMTTLLDAGADGVVLADVAEPSAVARATEQLLHPPAGERGWGPRRLSLRNRTRGDRPVQPSLWVQIESERGVERAAEIAAAPSVDAVIVGTADLSHSVGEPLDMASQPLREAVAAVARASEAAGTPFGVAGPIDAIAPEIREHASILVHSTDARLCADAVDTAAARLREILDQSQKGKR
jgi:4-hydroxy-2-oxoheptanedioate aldolase